MDGRDGQVPTPRRPGLLRLRRVAPAAPDRPTSVPSAAQDAAPRVADLSALLREIDSLRLTLQTDLTLAAAALDAGADELACELVDADIAELHGFAARADKSLARLNAAEQGPAAHHLPVAVPVRRRRMLSAGPALAAAAAILGFVVFAPDRGTPAGDTSMTSAVMAGYELNRLAELGAPPEELREAAEELNDELAELIAQAADDPAAARQALMLLEQTSDVLTRQPDRGVLRDVIAEVSVLRARLRESLPVVRPPVRPAVRPVVPQAPRVPRVQDKERERPADSAAPKGSPKPSPKPSPTKAAPAAATPSPAPAPTTAPEPRSSASPQPSDEPAGPLPGI